MSNFEQKPDQPLSLKNSDIAAAAVGAAVDTARGKKALFMKAGEEVAYNVLGRRLMHLLGSMGWNIVNLDDGIEKDIAVGALAALDASLRKGKKMNGALQDGLESGVISFAAKLAMAWGGFENATILGA